MSTYYTSCCDREPGDCICDEEVTVVELDEDAEARLVKSHGGFVDLMTELAASMRKGGGGK